MQPSGSVNYGGSSQAFSERIRLSHVFSGKKGDGRQARQTGRAQNMLRKKKRKRKGKDWMC